jgi:predicted CoA-substrate-specific enzyme activase
MNRRDRVLSIGLDLGSVAIKGVVIDGGGAVLRRGLEPVGASLESGLERLLIALLSDLTGRATLGVTGGGKGRFEAFAPAWIENDLVSSARAIGALHPEARGIIEVGGHQSKWIQLGGEGRMESFAINDQCAAGSGAFLEQQAGRLKLDIQALSALAVGASDAAPIAGRCAVFAKSDMIHLQQKGAEMKEIAFGLCMALARNFRATLLRGTEITLPAVLTGGGAMNAGLARAFSEAFELKPGEVLRAEEPRHVAALGVAMGARLEGQPCAIDELLAWPRGHLSARSREGGALSPLRAGAHQTIPEPVLRCQEDTPAYLGVDVGSVSTDLCLMSAEGEVLDGIYMRTRGDPVAVLREALADLSARTGRHLRILGVGTTGSGRHLAGSLLGADVVKNEITCQLLGARHVLPAVDTILEIGGQDSKYVSVRRGRIADFVMNKICAAGTGSFLEEQGEALGVSIFDEFGERAMAARQPASLGSQCTVFMDSEVVAARQRGIPLDDILAGLALSVVKNYLERVVAGRHIGDQVVFQGGVASNQAVVAAFEAELGEPVTVHPHNRVSGAIGAAVAAREVMTANDAGSSAFRGLDVLDEALVETFECRACTNYCQVSRIKVAGATTYFGDVCEKFSSCEGGARVGDLPDLAREVEQTLESFADGIAWRGTAGIPRASMMYDLFPFWATFLKSLGFKVILGGASSKQILEEGVRRLTAETCLPMKLVFGHVADLFSGHDDLDFVFLPAVQDIRDGAEASSHLCPFEESAGYMVASFASGRVVSPAVHLAAPHERIVRELKGSFDDWDIPEDQLRPAVEAAFHAQAQYEQRLRRRGSEVLAGDFERAFVLLGKPYNITDPFENLNLSGHLRKLGYLAIPQQMLPMEPVDLGARGITLPWRYNRANVQALFSILGDDRLYPILISNFGCGPDAFSMKVLEDTAGEKPALFLEFDEHRAEAGLITRLEAFIDEVSHDERRARGAETIFPAAAQVGGERYKGRRIVLPFFANHAYAYQGALRFAGLDAIVLPPPDEDTIAAGEAVSSGKECHPYVLLAGDLLKHLDAGTIRPGDVYFFPGTEIPCLMHQYASAIRLELSRRGVKDIEVLNPTGADHIEVFGFPGLMLLGRGLIAVDLMSKLQCQIRPYIDRPDELDERFERACVLLSDFMAVDRMGDALGWLGKELDRFPDSGAPRRPLVGVAGDIYTRIHPFGNRDLFRRLEGLGLEVWPAPFLTDSVGFGWRREMDWAMDDGNYREVAGSALMSLKKEWEELRTRYMLGRKIERVSEPSYGEVRAMVAPYVDPDSNETLVLNVAKMVDYARRGAHGVINAISFHCMLGTVSASLTEKIRRDHDRIPLLTLVYAGKDSAELDTRIEAFAHQVKSHVRARPASEKVSSWLPAFLK